eukprot:gene8033-biopygen6720
MTGRGSGRPVPVHLRVRVLDEPVAVDGEGELHHHPAADDVVVDVDHLRQCPHLEPGLPEPDVLLEQLRVAHLGDPCIPVRRAEVPAAELPIRLRLDVVTPDVAGRVPSLRPAPRYGVVRRVDRERLQPAHQRLEAAEPAVHPDLRQVAIVRPQLRRVLLCDVGVVLRGDVALPGQDLVLARVRAREAVAQVEVLHDRVVEAVPHARLLRGVDEALQHVEMDRRPRRADGVAVRGAVEEGRRRRPQGEPAAVLRGQDRDAGAEGRDAVEPLRGVEQRGVEGRPRLPSPSEARQPSPPESTEPTESASPSPPVRQVREESPPSPPSPPDCTSESARVRHRQTVKGTCCLDELFLTPEWGGKKTY